MEQGHPADSLKTSRKSVTQHTTVNVTAPILAALAPPDASDWIGTLENGPDQRSIRDQLVDLGIAMSAYFEELQLRLNALQGAGIAAEEVFKDRPDASGPAAAFRALASWLERARNEGRLGSVDTSVLATTILTAFQNRAFAAKVCCEAVTPDAGDVYVTQFFNLIWKGIAP